MVVSFLASNGTQAAPSTLFASSIKEGMLVYDDTNNALKLCDGTSWVALLGAGSVGSAAGTVTGAVQFRGSDGNLAADDSNFVWDDANDRLGIGTATPTYRLAVTPQTADRNVAVHFAPYNGTDDGFYITPWSGDTVLSAGGAYHGATFRAKNTSASVIDMNGGGFGFYGDTGLNQIGRAHV